MVTYLGSWCREQLTHEGSYSERGCFRLMYKYAHYAKCILIIIMGNPLFRDRESNTFIYMGLYGGVSGVE